MANIRLNVRPIQKHGTTAEWNLATSFIPYEGEIVLYTDVFKIKVGDGATTVVNLPFYEEEITLAALGINVSAEEINYLDGVTSNIQDQIDSKTSNTGTVTSVSGGNGLTGSVTTSGSLALGTPGTLTLSTTNSVTADSHTHDLNIATGTSTTAGLTKLYTSTGSSTDGTMTRSAITSALNGKADTSDIPTNYLTGGSQTTTSTADRGSNVFTFTKSDGSTATFTVKNGSKGSTGETGPQGKTGPQGPQGEAGPQGTAAGFGTPTVSTTTGVAGSNASVSITSSGSNTAKIFNFDFTIPRGNTGAQGPKGDTGPQGPAGQDGLTTAVSINGSTYTQSNGTVNLGTGWAKTSNIGDGTVTIQRNGSSVGSFSMNDTTNTTINISVPTNTTQLTNGSGYITAGATYSTTTPSGPKAGTLWFNPSLGYLQIYSGSSWVKVGAVWK